MHIRPSAAVVALCVLASTYDASSGIGRAAEKSLKSDLVGTWLLVSSEQSGTDGAKLNPYGTDPKGVLILDSTGHFAQIFVRADLPKLDRRTDGTPEQLRAIVDGSLSLYGTYTVDDASKTISMHYEASSFALFNDTDAKRTVTIDGDELTTVNYATGRYTSAEARFRRAK